MYRLTQRTLGDLTYQIIGAAIEVHKALGPGLLEQVYESCMAYELRQRGLTVASQQPVPISYKGLTMEANLKYDLLIENSIIVEVQSVETMLPIFEIQLLSYMQLLKKPKGILLNFHCTNIFKEGQKTLVNELYRQLPRV